MESQSLMTSTGLAVEYPFLGLALVPVLVVVAVYAYWSLRNSRRVEALLPRKRKTTLLLLVLVAQLLAPLLLVTASTGLYLERTEYVEVTVENALNYSARLPVNFVVLVDTSKSMLRSDTGARRIDVAKDFVEDLLSRMTSSDRVVLAVFSSNVTVVCQGLPQNCTSAVEGIEAGEKYSAIGDAIAFAEALAQASGLPTAIIVVSDMANNYGSPPLDIVRNTKHPVVLVRVGSDPRASWIEEARHSKTVRVLTVLTGSLDEIRSLARKTVVETRLSLYEGRSVIPIVKRDYTPTLLALLLSAILVAANLIATPLPPRRGAIERSTPRG